MNDLATAWYNLFEYIFNNISDPLARAIYETSLIEGLVNLLNQLINALFNLFREVPVVDLIYIGIDDIANLLGIIFLIVVINYTIKIIAFVIVQLKKVISSISSNSRKKVWRKQWKRS